MIDATNLLFMEETKENACFKNINYSCCKINCMLMYLGLMIMMDTLQRAGSVASLPQVVNSPISSLSSWLVATCFKAKLAVRTIRAFHIHNSFHTGSDHGVVFTLPSSLCLPF